ncbi:MULTISPECIES: right-handed parallel beta-helix repeat-containing protein [unclassified Microbacterium]|uniref:right-handed parallel beta-helix repeat-containing protein n=1 Tax=unclassified Microbacterium TaxID=2609290 RepID=UPI00301AD8C1
MATLAQATKVVKQGGTVVMRGGTYHQDALVYPHRGITIQPYLKEAVWLDGAEVVRGWSQSGNVWVKSGWNTNFDSSPTFVKGAPDGTAVGYVWINPAYPLAAHPDQVWVDGSPLTQVGSRAAVVAGAFFVDPGSKQLIIGTNPTGKRVEASTLQKALSIRSENGTVRGIGVKRYATSMPQKGTVTADYPGITLDNVTIVDNATTGFHTWSPNVTLNNVTLRNNGYMGFSVHRGDGFRATHVLSERNNSQHFNRTPGSGAMKVTETKTVSIRDSAFVDNWGQGVWFDMSVQDIVFADNDVVGNEGNGLVLEQAERATVANNLVANNGIAGIFLTNTGNAAFWNNTLVGNVRNINIAEDARRGNSAVPWITRNTSFFNNIVAADRGADCVMCVESWSKQLVGSTMLTKSEGNLYQVPSTMRRFALWANAAKGATSFSAFADYVGSTGRDKTSLALTASPVDKNFTLLSQYGGRSSAAQSIPSQVAAVSGLPAGSKLLGAQKRP